MLGPLDCALANKLVKRIVHDEGKVGPEGKTCMPMAANTQDKGKLFEIAKDVLHGGQGKTNKLNSHYKQNANEGTDVSNGNTQSTTQWTQPPMTTRLK